jgi:Ca2+-binding EF-hand superfamily protein
MNGIRVLIWTMAVMVLLGGCASTETQTSRKDYESLCAALDKDRRGTISKEEFTSGAKDKQEAARLFQLCDTNQDGQLSFEEYQRRQFLIHNVFELPPPPQVVPRR